MKIQPYNAADGEYLTLVEFAVEAAKLLDTSYSPNNIWSERETESVPYEHDTVRFHYGEEPKTIRVFYKIGYEPKYLGHAEDDVVVTCNGLPEGMNLELRILRYYHNPRFIEINVKGTDITVEKILEGFEKWFNVEHILEENEIRQTLQTARAALAVHAWRAAELHVQQVLKHEPHNAVAMMYLGIARATQGYEPEGENLLLASLTLDPRNVDAYYNLGLIVLDQGRCLLACDAFRKGLSIEPANHPLHYQLGRALERLGNLSEALNSYQLALTHSPNPDQLWGYTGKDFTVQARESIKRVNDAIQGNQTKTNEQCLE